MRYPRNYLNSRSIENILLSLYCCKERGDEWASEVEKRLLACIDLVAAEAVYHNQCISRFMLKKDLDKKNAGVERR